MNSKKKNNILLSIRLMTYNHSEFIIEALDGIDKQLTNFIFEVVIGDDFSTDDNLEKINAFEFKNKNIKVHILKREKGDAYWVKRQELGRLYNFTNIIENCKGKYIALLDGDDYWTDPLKLQKQVDFLEGNKDYVLCFHKVKILTTKDEIVDDFITEERYDRIKDFPISQKSLFANSNFTHTPSVMFRNIITDFPLEFKLSPVGDYFLYFMLSNHGYMHRIDEVMGVYRFGNGIYSKLSEKEKRIIGDKFQICLLSYTNSDYIKKRLIKNMFKKISYLEKNNIDNISIKRIFKIIIKRLKKTF